MEGELSLEEIEEIDAYWRASNYLAVGQIYLRNNPLLKRPLQISDIKPRLLGHWGTTPGLNFLYTHLNRVIKKYDLNMIFLAGPGHGGPAVVAQTYLEGSYSELYPKVSQDEQGLKALFTQFSYPGGIPSHASAETPGSIHEGGELGYSLMHAYGAVLDNPDLIAACVVGDGEAETGPLATSWHSNKFINPARDGAVLPILHLNGYKIAGLSFLARISREELENLFIGYGYKPYFVEGHEPEKVHRDLASTLDLIIKEIQKIQKEAREGGKNERPFWPMIIFRTPKGWTGPKEVEGILIEGTWRAHQVPLSEIEEKPSHLAILESWMKSYKPEELFDLQGRLVSSLQEMAPKGTRRMGMNPHANGGVLLKDLIIPDFRQYALSVSSPGVEIAESTRIMGMFLRDVMKKNEKMQNFRIFGPDETASNRLTSVFEVTDRMFAGEILPTDDHVSIDGRVMEVLSEHLCQGWFEGYLLTGRHGFFSCYEAFIHIVDSMFNQYAKWLKVCREIHWRAPIASLNYLLTSHVWRQDHNGFSHQDPGFIDHVMSKKADIVRIYLPPDVNTLLAVTDHCLKSRNYVNVIVAGKQPELQWMSFDDAVEHCRVGLGIFPWASHEEKGAPDVVMACAGDVPTLETLAAVDLLRKYCPELKVRTVNVVDLMALQPQSLHPHGICDELYYKIFPKNTQVIFAFHGYPSVIHKLTYRRTNYPYMHVHGYKEEGTTTTPFDMVVLNELDRFHLVLAVIDSVSDRIKDPRLLQQAMKDKLSCHREYVRKNGKDMDEIQNWRWGK